MNKRNREFGAIILIVSAFAICFDYLKIQLKDYTGSSLNFTPGIIFIIAANLAFAGLIAAVISRVKSNKPSSLLAIVLLVLGLILILFPLAYIPSVDFVRPYRTMQVNYTNVAGSLWLIIGVSTIIRRSRV
jgi:hypothetical protein